MPPQKVCPRCGDQYDASIAFCAKDGTRLIALGQTADLIGTVIAERYRITARLGEGGMGQVFLAEHVRMKRRSAIKIMRPALVGDSEALQRFSREAENASQISHPNVASIFDFGETSDGLVYLAMEYVEGEPLSDKLSREIALHPDMAADILGQAADGLQAAHDLGILHRDLKPDNIMLGKRPDGTFLVKLVDFGIARTIDSEAQKVTRTGFAVGTPEFMSPEQLAGDILDARSDQYSLALVAFIALTGKDAFPANTSKESLIARLTSRPQTLQEAKKDVEWPVGLQSVFDKALSPDASERYASVSAFAGELSEAISSMTPSQTAELYRFALRARLASVVQRTPQTDMERVRTPPTPVPTAERQLEILRSLEASTSGIRESTREFLSGVTTAPTEHAADTELLPRARQPLAPARVLTIVGVVAVIAIGGWLAFGRGSKSTTVAAAADSSAQLASANAANATGITAPPAATGVADSSAGTSSGASANSASPPVAAPTTATGTAANSPTPKTTPGAATTPAAGTPSGKSGTPGDSTRAKAIRDSVRAAAAKRAVDLSAKRNAFPESALKAALSGAPPEWRFLSVKNNDIRTMALSPVQLAWRNQQATIWKSQHVRGDVGTPYDMVDPVERWSAWSEIVRAKRPVIVLEVSPERVAFPSYSPAAAVDLKKGNVKSVEVTRDGVPVEISDMERIPAFVNQEEQVRAKKASLTEVLLTLKPDVFAPRPDGVPPVIEVVIIDADRRDAIRMSLSDFTVRQMWADLAPYRALGIKK